MGETKLQQRTFTLMMCIGMVFGMTTYNIILHTGFSSEVFKMLIKEVWVVFIVALVLDLFVVAPMVKKSVFSILKPDAKKIVVILSISISMVVSMVLLMSVFGTIFVHGFTMTALRAYPQSMLMNFIAALPLNLIVVSPLARLLFTKIFPSQETGVVEA